MCWKRLNTDSPDALVFEELWVEAHERLDGLIGYVDAAGHRKLKPQMFLSGEVAAYIITSSWMGREDMGEQVCTQQNAGVLQEILVLLSRDWDFEDREDLEDYIGISMSLWGEVTDHSSLALAQYNAEIAFLGSVCQSKLYGYAMTDTVVNGLEDEDYFTSNVIESYGYIIEAIRTRGFEWIEEYVRETRLYARHYVMFQV